MRHGFDPSTSSLLTGPIIWSSLIWTNWLAPGGGWLKPRIWVIVQRTMSAEQIGNIIDNNNNNHHFGQNDAAAMAAAFFERSQDSSSMTTAMAINQSELDVYTRCSRWPVFMTPDQPTIAGCSMHSDQCNRVKTLLSSQYRRREWMTDWTNHNSETWNHQIVKRIIQSMVAWTRINVIWNAFSATESSFAQSICFWNNIALGQPKEIASI